MADGDRHWTQDERDVLLEELMHGQEIASIGSWLWNPADATPVWSAGMYAVYGRDPADGPMRGEEVLRLVAPRDRDKVRAAFSTFDEGREHIDIDYRIVTAAGTTRAVQLIGRPIPGRPGCYRGTAQDVTRAWAAERAQRETARQLAAMIASAPIGIVVLLDDWTFARVNPAFCEMLGYSEEELLAMSFLDVTHEEERVESAERLPLRFAEIGSGGTVRRRCVHRSGATVWVRLSAAYVADENGGRGSAVALVEDITAEREAERTLGLFAAMVESSNDAIITTTLDGTINTWNPAAERMYGYGPNDAIGKRATLLAPGQPEITLVNERFARLAGGERIEPFETTALRSDGSVIEVSVTLSPIRDVDGAVVGAASATRDITARRRAERALVRSRERLEQAELVAHIGSWEWDLVTGEVSWSAGLYDIFKLDPKSVDESIDMCLQTRAHPDDRELVQQALERASQELTSAEVQYRALRADGRVRILDGRFDPIVDETGRTVRVIAVLHDLTETKRTHDALHTASSNLARYARELELLALQDAADAGARAPSPLSPRQLEILRLVAKGLTNADIAKRVYVTEGTVKWHVKQILAKTGAANRTEAVVRVFGPGGLRAETGAFGPANVDTPEPAS